MKLRSIKKLIIVGTGLFAELAYCYFNRYTSYKIEAFACDEKYIKNNLLFDTQVINIESIETLFDKKNYHIFIAIGYRDLNKVREKFFKKYEKLGYEFANFIHPNVDIWDNSKVGKNNFIFENNVIQPFVKIGDNNIIWSGNHIGHHSIIGSHNFISSHVVLSGNCKLKNNIFLGVNSTIIDNSIVENNVFVDANVLIKNQTKENEFYVSKKNLPHKLTTDQLKFLK